MKEGGLVPDEWTIELIRTEIERRLSAAKGFLIDGFPRNVEQAAKFEAGVCRASFALWFDLSEDAMVERLIKRGETSGRSDDNLESVRKRIATFNEKSLPVRASFEVDSRLRSVDSGRGLDEVFADVCAVVDPVCPPVPAAAGAPGPAPPASPASSPLDTTLSASSPLAEVELSFSHSTGLGLHLVGPADPEEALKNGGVFVGAVAPSGPAASAGLARLGLAPRRRPPAAD